MSGKTCMTVAQRMELRPGAVVAYRSGKMLSEVVGTVDTVNETTGAVILSDGTWVKRDDSIRLVKAVPGEFPARTELPPEDQGSAGDREEDSEGAPAGNDSAGQDQRRLRRDHGVRKVDRGPWLEAVKAVRARMAAGESQASAVAAVAPTAGVKLTMATCKWWQAALVSEGLIELGPKTMPRRKGGKSPAVPAPAVAAMHADVAAQMKRERDELQGQLDSLKEAYAKVQAERARLAEEALQLRADRGALQRTLEDLQKAVGKGDVHSGAVRRMDLRQTLTETETLVRELAMQWLLADIGRQAAEGLVRILDRARKAEPVDDERRTEA